MGKDCCRILGLSEWLAQFKSFYKRIIVEFNVGVLSS